MIEPFREIPKDLREWSLWIRAIESQGQATISLTGYGTTVTGAIEWVRLGRRVTIHAPETITGTSNATGLTMTGLPDAITPASAKSMVVAVTDDGGLVPALATISGTTITFAMGSPFSATGFTATGTKAIPAGWQFHYVLDS